MQMSDFFYSNFSPLAILLYFVTRWVITKFVFLSFSRLIDSDIYIFFNHLHFFYSSEKTSDSICLVTHKIISESIPRKKNCSIFISLKISELVKFCDLAQVTLNNSLLILLDHNCWQADAIQPIKLYVFSLFSTHLSLTLLVFLTDSFLFF